MTVSRRKFLTGITAAGALALSVCVPIKPAPAPPPPPPPPPPAPGPSDKVVIVFLYGGNDGLNTVIPYTDPTYLAKRGPLALGAAQGVLPIGDGLALHPAMTGIKAMCNRGDLAVVRGVGYPSPDRSHFRSTDIWESARPDAVVSTGWIGRWLDSTTNPLDAVAVSSTLPRTLRGSMETGVAVSGGSLSLPGTTAFRAAFNTLATGDPGDPALATTWVRAENELLHAQQVLNPALSAANPPGSALAGVNTSIGRSFASIARMIRNPNVPTRVFMTGMGGFDTHTNQLPTQAALLGQLDAAVNAFHTDMANEPRGAGVVTMVVSEFGRRLNANADLGTDHGTCAPVLVLGAPVLGGFYGAQPSLTALDRQGDPIATTDFRSIYSTVLQRTLKVDAAAILGTSAFAPMPFL